MQQRTAVKIIVGVLVIGYLTSYSVILIDQRSVNIRMSKIEAQLESGSYITDQYLQGVKAGLAEGETQTKTALKSEIEKSKKEGVCTPTEGAGTWYIQL